MSVAYSADPGETEDGEACPTMDVEGDHAAGQSGCFVQALRVIHHKSLKPLGPTW